MTPLDPLSVAGISGKQGEPESSQKVMDDINDIKLDRAARI